MCSRLLSFCQGKHHKGKEKRIAKYRQVYIWLCVLLLLGITPQSLGAQRYLFNLPAMNASTALEKLADITGYSLIYPFDQSVVVITNPLSGHYSVEEALDSLLLHTVLSATATEKRVIAVSAILKTDNNNEALTAAEDVDTSIINAAANSAEEHTDNETKAERIQIIGSRRVNRSPSDALAPLDIINRESLTARGSNDIISTLANVIPSYNVRQEAISDAGTMVRPANLRGLPTDSMLVLVDGKRRHRSGVIYEYISGVNVGAHGVDLEPIPTVALKSVEVLRDGAAAQYGSDAIAGVVNFRLENSADIRHIEMRTGRYYAKDGTKLELAGILGAAIGKSITANFSFELSQSDATSRGIQDPAVESLIASGIAEEDIEDPVVNWGAPEITDNIKLLTNMTMDIGAIGDYQELYLFANWAQRDIDGSFFYRNPNTRASVYVNPNNGTRLFFDMTENGIGDCPVPTIPGDPGDAQALALVADNPGCFSFNERFPGGFTPRFGGRITDNSLAFGMRGALGKQGAELSYDLSLVTGENYIDYQLRNSVNASLGEHSPSQFELGSQIQTERVVNADFTYPLELGLESELNIAFGYQHHFEQFEVVAGELASYQAGPFFSQGEAVGANGFPGFSPDTAGVNTRHSNALYLDVEGDITEDFLLSLAMRYEDIGKIGRTFDGKFSARMQVTDNIALRSTLSTGFRAPTVGQATLQRISTSNSVVNDVIVQQGSQLVSALSPIATARSGGKLKAETAESFSFGLLADVAELNLTLDYFYIAIDDRLSLFSSEILASDAPLLAASGVNANVANIHYYANDFNSVTQGVDLVASYPFEFFSGKNVLSFAFNYTETELKVTNAKSPIAEYNARKEREHGVPQTRAVLSYSYLREKLAAMVRVNHYGSFYNAQFNDVSLLEKVAPMVITDIEASYQLTDNLAVTLGAKNLFDVYPEKFSQGQSAGFLGAIYPLNSPTGFNGGHYYLRLAWDF